MNEEWPRDRRHPAIRSHPPEPAAAYGILERGLSRSFQTRVDQQRKFTGNPGPNKPQRIAGVTAAIFQHDNPELAVSVRYYTVAGNSAVE
jgi:hypothetical protein